MSGSIILLLAAVFLFAALAKLRSQNEFAEVLRNLVPSSLVKMTALAIPLLEVLLAGFLLSGIASRAAAMASVAVLAVFTIVLTVMWRRGVKGCGCFGEDNNTATTGSGIIRNLILIALAVLIAIGPENLMLYGPDVATLLGRMTVVAGAFCLWPCIVALVERRKLIFNFAKT
jgi:uncharacterized membrane protein YphA (DoxX/SURF4 family)